jgi:hypothetical protein
MGYSACQGAYHWWMVPVLQAKRSESVHWIIVFTIGGVHAATFVVSSPSPPLVPRVAIHPRAKLSIRYPTMCYFLIYVWFYIQDMNRRSCLFASKKGKERANVQEQGDIYSLTSFKTEHDLRGGRTICPRVKLSGLLAFE